MQLISLYIKKYNHLVDFTIAFNQNLSVIIGVNGSGKSSVLEVLALVFSDAYLGKKAALGFKLTYKLAKTTVELSSEDTGFEIQMNGKKIDNFLLPSNVVVYYSGLSDKMEKLCKVHEENQEKAFKTGRANKRPFFYYRPQNFKMLLEKGVERDDMKTEHLVPQTSSYSIKHKLDITYSNMFACCMGGKGKTQDFKLVIHEKERTLSLLIQQVHRTLRQ